MRELEVLAIVMEGGGGQRKMVLPLKRVGAQKDLCCLERGRTKFWTRDFPIL